jgi:hypothetical protein
MEPHYQNLFKDFGTALKRGVFAKKLFMQCVSAFQVKPFDASAILLTTDWIRLARFFLLRRTKMGQKYTK